MSVFRCRLAGASAYFVTAGLGHTNAKALVTVGFTPSPHFSDLTLRSLPRSFATALATDGIRDHAGPALRQTWHGPALSSRALSSSATHEFSSVPTCGWRVLAWLLGAVLLFFSTCGLLSFYYFKKQHPQWPLNISRWRPCSQPAQFRTSWTSIFSLARIF